MSERIQPNDDPIDIDRPYLVERTNGTIEVWHIERREDGAPILNQDGLYKLVRQQHEVWEAGLVVRPTRYLGLAELNDGAQAEYAAELGLARDSLTTEQLDRQGTLLAADTQFDEDSFWNELAAARYNDPPNNGDRPAGIDSNSAHMQSETMAIHVNAVHTSVQMVEASVTLLLNRAAFNPKQKDTLIGTIDATRRRLQDTYSVPEFIQAINTLDQRAQEAVELYLLSGNDNALTFTALKRYSETASEIAEHAKAVVRSLDAVNELLADDGPLIDVLAELIGQQTDSVDSLEAILSITERMHDDMNIARANMEAIQRKLADL